MHRYLIQFLIRIPLLEKNCKISTHPLSLNQSWKSNPSSRLYMITRVPTILEFDQFIDRKYLVRGYILGVLVHTTAWLKDGECD